GAFKNQIVNLCQSGLTSYRSWTEYFDTISQADAEAIKDHYARLTLKPPISIVMPVWNTPEAYLRAAIESVLAQLYPDWELCIADDASKKPHVRHVLAEYSARDPRVC